MSDKSFKIQGRVCRFNMPSSKDGLAIGTLATCLDSDNIPQRLSAMQEITKIGCKYLMVEQEQCKGVDELDLLFPHDPFIQMLVMKNFMEYLQPFMKAFQG